MYEGYIHNLLIHAVAVCFFVLENDYKILLKCLQLIHIKFKKSLQEMSPISRCISKNSTDFRSQFK